jgi:hypothetical protein
MEPKNAVNEARIRLFGSIIETAGRDRLMLEGHCQGYLRLKFLGTSDAKLFNASTTDGHGVKSITSF